MLTGKPGSVEFDGYARLSLWDADRMVREFLVGRLENLTGKVRECSEKARAQGREKLLSEIDTIERRLSRIRDLTVYREGSYVPPYMKQGISRADTQSLNETDGRLEALIDEAFAMISDLSCSEKDLYIIDKLSAISGVMRSFESDLNSRSRLLKREAKP